MFRTACVLVFILSSLAATVLAVAAPRDALQMHMANILADGDEWRTPNPAYEEGSDGPLEFGLTMTLAEDRSHVTGTLHGIYKNGVSVPYWSMLALYNPVTEKVITQQIGSDGTLIRGEVPYQPDDEQTIDMILYGASGDMKMTRHVQRYDGPQHESLVYERGANDAWQLTQTWLWERHAAKTAMSPDAGKPPSAPGDPLMRDAGYLLSGSGQWRADNANYVENGDAPQQYGMNFRWGRHGRHIVGEILSLYADGRQEKEWSLFITHNPVTGRSYMEQTGGNGVYFHGELGRGKDGRHVQSGLVYLPSGTVLSVRDEVEIIDDNTRVAHVFERDENGAWQPARIWTWKQLAEDQ